MGKLYFVSQITLLHVTCLFLFCGLQLLVKSDVDVPALSQLFYFKGIVESVIRPESKGSSSGLRAGLIRERPLGGFKF